LIPADYFDRFDTPKYQNRNPVHRKLIQRFVQTLHGLFIEANPIESVLEIGVGEGFLSGYLSEKFPEKRFTGIDLREEDVMRLRRLFPAIRARAASVYELEAAVGKDAPFDLILCCEVLEHLEDPARALDQMLALRPRRLLLSVPHEPFFMLSNLLRGKNVTRFGNDVEHINHWGTGSFRKLLETRLSILQLTTSYPWILALTAPK
jgi:2-polyprenyl-3-methyl-5-hydroxy-6-metoxy-1,4-benzoquinol methylase